MELENYPIKGHVIKIADNRRKRFVIKVLVLILFLLLIFFNKHLICLFGFVNCYVTWPLFRPIHLKIDLSNLHNENKVEEYIPRRMHHILLGPLNKSPPLSWVSSRNSCISLHSNFSSHYFWNDQNGKEFLEQNYPWFLDTWNSYLTYIQKADALRYFVLYHYGGIFLDMDLFCIKNLDFLFNYLDKRTSSDKHAFLAVKAFPVGISNGFLITTAKHPLLEYVIHNLELYNRNFILPHATVVISTGPMFISIQMQLHYSIWKSIIVLDGNENMLGGKTDTPLFKHLGSASWHKADGNFFKSIPIHIQHQSQTFSLYLFFIIVSFIPIIIITKNKFFITVTISLTLSLAITIKINIRIPKLQLINRFFITLFRCLKLRSTFEDGNK